MSSKIEVQRICQQCGNEFTARTTVTRFCSNRCASVAHKQKMRVGKVEGCNKETLRIRTQPIEELKAKEFLTVREVARLLNCSLRSAYHSIEGGTIKAVNFGQRITRVKRSEIDRLFELSQPVMPQPEQQQCDISDCYNLTEVQDKYGISQTTLQNLIKRHSIPKIKRGWFAYVPKTVIDDILS
ncbi:MAG: helix-turn-helix domain-containing protein [Chlorobiaceae bacterium]